MRILLIHNYYRLAGGEDAVFRAEKALLQSHNQDVRDWTRSNTDIREDGVGSKLRLLRDTLSNPETDRLLSPCLRDFKPQVAHIHNTFPLISPSVYRLLGRHGIPVVQTLHNYRLLCPNGLLFRDNAPCELCVGRLPLPAVRYACYRNSRPASGAVALMLAWHRCRRTFHRGVNRYIALTEFSRDKFLQGGLPEDKISVKPNFTGDPGSAPGSGHGAFFAGRLSPEKGLGMLLDSWTRIPATHPLVIAGDGPSSEGLRAQAAESNLRHVRFLGQKEPAALAAFRKSSLFCVVSSIGYETFGLVVAEAFAAGKAVLAPRHGVFPELIEDGVTGLLYKPGDPQDLAAKARRLFEHPGEAEAMGRNARGVYMAKYTPERNYDLLMGIYEEAIASSR